jgi:Skp family chaperone for outer membrane proteins
MKRALRALICAALAGFVSAASYSAARAQDVGIVQSDILVVDPERLFELTVLGQAMTADHQAAREDLAARNRRLEAELEAEERRLTDLRDTTDPEEFRQMADAFDMRVQEIRSDSERRVRDLERDREQMPVIFLRRVEPILLEVMREAGAEVMLNARTVLYRTGSVDITEVAAQRIDAAIGSGQDEAAQPPDSPSVPAPE